MEWGPLHYDFILNWCFKQLSLSCLVKMKSVLVLVDNHL